MNVVDEVGAALALSLPVIMGGLLHVAAIKARVLPRLAAVPLDGRATLRGRRILGDNKTLRGVVVMVTSTALSAWVCAQAGVGPFTLPVQTEAPLWWGALLGLGYIVGELPNSFLKRQLDIAPGDPAPVGRRGLRAVFWMIDQLDFLVGIAVVVAVAGHPLPLSTLITLGIVGLVVHPLVAGLMVLLGLKSRVG